MHAVLATALGLFVAAATACGNRSPTAPSPRTTVVAFGDSITAGVGTSGGNDYVSLLSNRTDIPIITAGRSGDTTGAALARIDSAVLSRDADIVIVLLGGNGGQLPAIAGQTSSTLVPDLLDGIFGVPEFMADFVLAAGSVVGDVLLQRIDLAAQIADLLLEQPADRQQAHHTPVRIENGEMAKVSVEHEADGFVSGALIFDGFHVGGHHVAHHRGFGKPPRLDDAQHEVALGKDAAQDPVVHDGHGADAVVGHDGDCIQHTDP